MEPANFPTSHPAQLAPRKEAHRQASVAADQGTQGTVSDQGDWPA